MNKSQPQKTALPSVECSDLLAAQEELDLYIGIPKCIDCKWKLGTEITNNCGCVGAGADNAKWKTAFDRARFLQRFIRLTAP